MSRVTIPDFKLLAIRLATAYADMHFDPAHVTPERMEEIRQTDDGWRIPFWQYLFMSHLCWIHEKYGLEKPELVEPPDVSKMAPGVYSPE